MHNLRLTFTTTRIIVISWIIPLLILASFQAIPVFSSSDSQYIYQASLQRTRAQFFARAVLILEYRPIVERTQTISDLQVSYPLFQHEQAVLLTNNQPDVQLALQTVRPDYLALATAINTVLADTNQNIDPTQVDIILAHTKAYSTAMDYVITLLQQHDNERILQLFIIEIAIETLLTISLMLTLFKCKSLLTRTSQKDK